jgi:hypothetical protein
LRAGALRVVAAPILAVLLCLCATAEAARVQRTGYSLDLDASRWSELRPAPPAELILACKARDCRPDTQLAVLRDRRPLPSPGAGGFTPGAAAAAAISLRAQDLTPGARLVPLRPALPMLINGIRLYFAMFEVEDRELRHTWLATALMPMDGVTLHWRLTAPANAAKLDQLLLDVLSGLRLAAR